MDEMTYDESYEEEVEDELEGEDFEVDHHDVDGDDDNEIEDDEDEEKVSSNSSSGDGGNGQMESERLRDSMREIGKEAVWSLSTAKPGNGVDQLRDGNVRFFSQFSIRVS